MIVPFGTSSYKSAAPPVSSERLINMYCEQEPPDAKTSVAVFGCPGITPFTRSGTGPIRGFHDMGGLLYVVSGPTLYSVTSDGTTAALGGAVSGTGVVSMDDNGTQLVITNGTYGYIYTTTTGLSLITDVDFHAANTVTFFDQRFVYDRAGTNQFFASDSLDGTSYDPLVIASAEARPDNVVAVILNAQMLMVFGVRTIEFWSDVGAANFPYERVPGALIERGILAPMAKCKADNTVFFIGDNRVLYRVSGMSLQRVSNFAVEHEWATYTTVSDCFMFAFQMNGHEFVVVTFPSQPKTWVLDVATGLPHERESWDQYNNNYGRWRINCHRRMYGKELVGDQYSNNIGYLDNSAYTEFGCTIQGTAVSPPIHSDRKRVFMSRFELDVESGVGLSTGQGSDPQIMLDYSDDGGRTFSTRQLWKSMGVEGAYKQRLRWTRLGQSRNRVMRLTITDPVRRTLIAANADITVGL